MTDRHAVHVPGPAGDLEYDLVHEEIAASAPAAAAGDPEREPVVTSTPEYDGDYSYDLAHDVPSS